MLEELINSENFKKYNKLKLIINKEINGRVCLNNYIQILPTIKDLLLKNKCKNYCEIGVLHGGSMSLILNTEEPCNCYGIDIFSYYGKQKDPTSNVVVTMENTYNNINKFNQNQEFKVELINGNSHDIETLNQLISKLNGEKIDLLFIDGDHTYDGVINDIEKYIPLVSSGGIIMFDNYGSKGWPEVLPAVDQFILNNVEFELLFKHGESCIIQKK